MSCLTEQGAESCECRNMAVDPQYGAGTRPFSYLTCHAPEVDAQMTFSFLREARGPEETFVLIPPLAHLAQRGIVRTQQEVTWPAYGH